jgi:NlpB/DapX lipoprotein
VAILIVAGLLGCQQPQRTYVVERSRTYQQSKTVVWGEIVRFLQANDITVRQSDPASGMIEADRQNYQDTAGWAECELARATDRSSDSRRPRRARQRLDRSVSLMIAVREAGGGTEVTVDGTFTERQIHPWRNLPFRTGCVSTGVFERALFDAIGADASGNPQASQEHSPKSVQP